MSDQDDKSIQVMFAYRRADSEGRSNIEFVERLRQELAARFEIQCYQDIKCNIPGDDWRKAWCEHLDAPADQERGNFGPTVVVIIGPHDVPKPQAERDIVVEEIFEALRRPAMARSNKLVVLQFGASGWDALKPRLRARSSLANQADLVAEIETSHQPPQFSEELMRTDLTDAEWNRVCAPIVRRVRAYFVKKLLIERARTESWCEAVIDRLLVKNGAEEFPIQQERSALNGSIKRLVVGDRKKAVVAVGPGGLGKTTQVAQTLKSLLDQKLIFYPILLSKEEIDDLDTTLVARFELKWLSGDRSGPISLADEGLDWCKDKLCFITDSLERADDVDKSASELRRLQGAAKLILTCRPQAWEKAQARLLVDTEDVIELQQVTIAQVQQFLGIKDGGQVAERPYLRNPVFLDIARYRLKDTTVELAAGELRTETDLLLKFRNFCLEPAEPTKSQQDLASVREACQAFLSDLAAQQLEDNRFDVDQSKLSPRHDAAIDRLTSDRLYAIVERTADGVDRVRLRHDIIDSYNIARYFDKNTSEFEKALFSACSANKRSGKLHFGFGQVLFEGVVQAAHDRQRQGAIDMFFAEFLRLVDNKEAQVLQSAAWNAGYVIGAKYHVFAHLIKRAISGKFIGKLPPPRVGEAVSSFDALTENALSSVASMMGPQPPLSIEDVHGELLSALTVKIGKVPLKARLIEGLSRINRPSEVISVLSGFASTPDAITEDPGFTRYIARALAAAGSRAPKAELDRIFASLTELRQTQRQLFDRRLPSVMREIDMAESALADHHDRIAAGAGMEDNETALTVTEVLEGLSNVDPALRRKPCEDVTLRFSDWTIVEQYLRWVKDTKGHVEGTVQECVILAVGRCLWHLHQRCREKAAETLGAIGHPLARGLLLHVLTFETEDSLEKVLLDALAAQAKTLPAGSDARERFRRALLRAVAARSSLVGDQRASELAALVQSIGPATEALVTADWIELRRFHLEPPQLVAEEGEVPPLPRWLTEAERCQDVGAELEAKVCFSLQTPISDRLGYRKSNWRNPRRFHLALRRRLEFFSQLAMERGGPKDIEPIWVAEHYGYKRRHELAVSRHFTPPWKVWQDRDDEQIANYVEAVARTYSDYEAAAPMPTIATVHVILVLCDGMIVEAKRSSEAAYVPGAWAASFEEQVKREDIEPGGDIAAVVTRGLLEEFGVALRDGELRLRAASLGIEWALMNLSLLVVAEMTLSSGDFWTRAKENKSDGELQSVAMRKASARLASIQIGTAGCVLDKDLATNHPTSGARLALLKHSLQAFSNS